MTATRRELARQLHDTGNRRDAAAFILYLAAFLTFTTGLRVARGATEGKPT